MVCLQNRKTIVLNACVDGKKIHLELVTQQPLADGREYGGDGDAPESLEGGHHRDGDGNQAFIVMMFGDDEMESVYEGVFLPTIRRHGLRPRRIDDIQDSGLIIQQIFDEIDKSKIVVCDLTGEKLNCYLESGYAIGKGKEIIFSIKKGEKIPFDLAGHRFIKWKTEADLRKQLDRRLAALKT